MKLTKATVTLAAWLMLISCDRPSASHLDLECEVRKCAGMAEGIPGDVGVDVLNKSPNPTTIKKFLLNGEKESFLGNYWSGGGYEGYTESKKQLPITLTTGERASFLVWMRRFHYEKEVVFVDVVTDTATLRIKLR